MSGGVYCINPVLHRPWWRIIQRYCNHSAFNGYHQTPSQWSSVRCLDCGGFWRTKAAYVSTIPSATDAEATQLPRNLLARLR